MIVVVTLGVALILSIADHIAANATCCGTNGGAFETAPGLMANDAAECRAAEGTDDGSGLGIWATGARDQKCSAQKDEDFVFHEV